MHKWHTVGSTIKNCRNQWCVYTIKRDHKGQNKHILHSKHNDLTAAQTAQNQIKADRMRIKNRANIRSNSKYRE